MADRVEATTALLEREPELQAVHDGLEAAAEGRGSTLTFTGEPGIGKTRLLGAIRASAEQAGMQVLVARGDDLERELPFGVVLQLLETTIARTPDAEKRILFEGSARLGAAIFEAAGTPAAPGGDPALSRIHGLYWLIANLAERSPIALLVDDAQWADRESLRFLDYLTARTDGVAILVALAARDTEPGAENVALQRLLGKTELTNLRPTQLSTDAVAALTASMLGEHPDAEFARACHAVTDGNPFLLGELLRELSGLPDGARTAETVRELGPASIAHGALARIAPLGPDASALARAAAVLGDGAELREAAALAGLSGTAAAAAFGVLTETGVLRERPPVEFVHAIIRSAIEGDLAAMELARMHAAAARQLADEGAPAHRVAAHLRRTEPAGEAWVVDCLRAAARKAGASGSPRVAAAFLSRALREPPDPALRGEILSELGLAEFLGNEETEALGHLAEARELQTDPIMRAALARPTALMHLLSRRPARAIAELEAVIEGLPADQRALGLQLEIDIWRASHFSLRAREVTLARTPRFEPQGDERELPMVLARAAMETVMKAPAAEAAELARRALAGGRLLTTETSDSPTFYMAVNALALAGETEEAHGIYTDAIADANDRGSLRGFALASCYRALTSWGLGELREAEEDARAFLNSQVRGLDAGRPVAVAAMVNALLERGRLGDAEQSLSDFPVEDLGEPSSSHFYHARGRLRLAQRRTDEALADQLECERRETSWGIESPCLTSWRTQAALALVELGDRSEAIELCDVALERTKAFGSPRLIGAAQRDAGLVHGDEKGIELLRAGAETLARSSARLEHARALVELGAALRRHRKRTESRGPLKAGLELARRCGASALVERAYDELAAAGARSRKILRVGVDALTASEIRIARLAAEGMTNKQIAQQLWVTVKTVETHLGHCYQKLEISSREQLPGALDPS